MIIASAFPVRALIVASLINFTTSFLAQRSSSSSYLQGVHTCFGDQQCINRIDSTALSMDFGKFFNDAFGMDDSDDKKKKSLQSFNEDDDEDEDDDEHGDLGSSGLGCTNIFKIEVNSMKKGGCRLYLSLFLIGETNNPQRGTWKMDQNEEGGIDLFYKDFSGALMIKLEDNEIIVNRMGSRPSMDYFMSETLIINVMLDQLDEIAFDKSIDAKDRLIILNEPGDAIDVVRESLSFN